MLHIYFLLLFLNLVSGKQMGCILNITFVSMDIKSIQINLTLNQCVCYQWQHNFTGFNYFTQNQACELFQNFTTNFELVEDIQTRFCFISLPTAATTIAPDPTTTPFVTSTLTSTAGYTTMVLDVATTAANLKWNPTGISIASANGNSSILNPYAVFVDDQYYIYIAEKGNSRISKWPPNPGGSSSAAIFQTANGQLNQPPSLYVNTLTDGIYVADESNHRVVFFANGSTTGSNVTGASYHTSPGVDAIYLDPNGTIFITDTAQNRIYNWFTNQTVAGGQGAGPAANQLNQPRRFFIDSNYSFYIADLGNNRVQKWLRGATSDETVAGGYGAGSNTSQLSGPLGVVVDSQGNVLACDAGNNRVQMWSPGATTGRTVAGNSNGTAGSGPNELNAPRGLALDKDDNLYVVDLNNLRIQKFNIL